MERAREPEIRLTVRGRRVVAALVAVGVALLAWWWLGPSDTDSAAPAAMSTRLPDRAQPSTTATKADPTTSKPTTAPSPSPTTDSTTIRRTGMKRTGEYRNSTITAGHAVEGKTVRYRYYVRVETSAQGIDPNEVVRKVQKTLDDERSWVGAGRFVAVTDPKQANLTVYVASPDTVDRNCAPVRTVGTWSCATASAVFLNADRWLLMTPTYDDLDTYRTYMINHEFGHTLGHGHVGCPGKGVVAPVMFRQSMGLEGCTRNPWPRVGNRAPQ